MRKRNIDKHIRFTKSEAQDLQKKSKKACLSEAGLIRVLIKGYEPKEKPDDRFYDVMREIYDVGSNIRLLCDIAKSQGIKDFTVIKQELEKLNKFQSKVEKEFLRPSKSELKWQ